MAKIDVLEKEIRLYEVGDEEYISLTDIAKHKNPIAPADTVKNWLRSKNTIELLGLWERLHNPHLNWSNSTSLKTRQVLLFCSESLGSIIVRGVNRERESL